MFQPSGAKLRRMGSKPVKTKAFSYIRMSSERQLLGDSLKRQFELAQAYAAEHDLELDNMKPDVGLSGWTGANRLAGTLHSFLAKIGTPAVPAGSMLLVESLDRISRQNVLEAQALFLSIINAGVTIVTLSKTGQRVYEREAMTKSPLDLIVSMLEMVRANEESELKSRRLKGAWQSKRERIASDEKMTRACPAWLDIDPDTGQFVMVPDKVETVRRIFNELANGVGKDRLARRLNDDGVQTLRVTNKGAGWHASTILHLVRSKAVLGLYQPCVIVHENGKKKRQPLGEPIENYYPPIISEELYQRTVAAMAGRRNAGSLKNGGRKGVRLSNLFGDGLATCEDCGGPMLFKRGTPRNPSSYIRCGNAARKAGCENHTHYRYEPLEASVLAALVDLDVIDNAAPTDQAELSNELASNTRLLASAKEALNNQVKAMDAVGPIPAIVERISTLQADIERLGAAITDNQVKLAEANSGGDAQRIAVISELVGTMAAASDSDAYVIRSRIAVALRGLVDFMSFDRAGVATVSIFHGLKAYRFNRYGALTDTVTVNTGEFSTLVADGGEMVRVTTNADHVRSVYTHGDPEREAKFDRMVG
jgi:DNA invertase Pin-like site-specific DNA recombinase